MTAATFGLSSGASVSFSTIDAMIRTSYGVRFLLFAYARLTWFQFLQNVSSWSAASSRDGVVLLARGDLGDHADALDHLRAREALGEDDAERLWCRWRRRERLRGVDVRQRDDHGGDP